MYLLGLLLSVVLYWYLGPWVFSVVCSPSLLCRSSMTASVAIFAALSSCCVTQLLSVYISNSRTMDDVRTHILIHRSFPCFATNITIRLSSITTTTTYIMFMPMLMPLCPKCDSAMILYSTTATAYLPRLVMYTLSRIYILTFLACQ